MIVSMTKSYTRQDLVQAGVASGELGNVSVVPRHGRVAVADDCLDYRQRRVGFATHAHEGVPQ